MDEQVESGHVDAQPTEDLTEARNKALAAHQNAVEKHGDEPVLVADENNVDQDDSNVEPFKDERASAPVQVDAPEFVTTQSVPDRHDSNSAYDEEGRDKTVDDADFDVDEKDEDANG